MTEQEIFEGNKLITEFMGGYVSEDGDFYIEDDSNPWPDDIGYNLSWDWLMPVCKKIINMYFDRREYIFEGLTEVDLDKTFKAVVEFIKFWNDPAQEKLTWTK